MEKTLPAVEAPLEAQVRPLPEPVPAYSCGDRLRPCKRCGADAWSDGEDDYGSLGDGGSYERFKCRHCGNVIYVALPD
jgi:hypothetical protein